MHRRTTASCGAAATALAAAALMLAGCSSSPTHHRHLNATTADLSGSGGAIRNLQTGQILRLGIPADFASAPALAGLQLGLYRADLGGVAVEPQAYVSDLQEVQALEHGQLDAAYLDPVAALNAWQATAPGFLRIIAGATTGSSQLIARHGITRAAQLRGTRVEAPAASSQAAYLGAWLASNHLTGHVSLDGSAITTIGILEQFKTGQVSAAWEPAPLDQQLIAAGGHQLASQPGGPATTAVLVVTQRYLTANPVAVRNLLKAQIQACARIGAHPGPATTAGALEYGALTGIHLPASVVRAAAAEATCSENPDPAAIQAQARLAAAAAIIHPVTSLTSLYDLDILNALLHEDGQQAIRP